MQNTTILKGQQKVATECGACDDILRNWKGHGNKKKMC